MLPVPEDIEGFVALIACSYARRDEVSKEPLLVVAHLLPHDRIPHRVVDRIEHRTEVDPLICIAAGIFGQGAHEEGPFRCRLSGLAVNDHLYLEGA